MSLVNVNSQYWFVLLVSSYPAYFCQYVWLLVVMLYPGSANCRSSSSATVITSACFISDNASQSCGYRVQNDLFQYFCLINCEQVAWYVTVFYVFLDMFLLVHEHASIYMFHIGSMS